MTTQEANQRLAADLKLVIRDAEDLLRATGSQTGEKVEEVRQRLNTALESAKGTCDRLQERLQEKTAECAKVTDQAIREHPYETLGVAFGVGLLLGLVLGRR